MKLNRKQRQRQRKQEAVEAARGCSRCKLSFDKQHVLQQICEACLKENPVLTSDEKNASNIWDELELVERIVQIAREARSLDRRLFGPKDLITPVDQVEPPQEERWSWGYNHACKYLNIRIDMRDGGCLVTDSEGKRIGIDALNWQWSEENPERPLT